MTQPETVHTTLTPDDLNTLVKAYTILTDLGDQTKAGGPVRTWDVYVDTAHHYLALVLVRFEVGRWRGTEGWHWPDVLSPPLLNFEAIREHLRLELEAVIDP